MAVKDEVAAVQQQVLAAGLGAVEAAAVEPLDPGGAAARVGSADRQRLPAEGGIEPPRQPQDRVALCHLPIMNRASSD